MIDDEQKTVDFVVRLLLNGENDIFKIYRKAEPAVQVILKRSINRALENPSGWV